MTAGFETLKIISKDMDFYKNLAANSLYFYEGIENNLHELKLKFMLNSCGSMFTLFFTNRHVIDYDSAKTSDLKKFTSYFNSMLDDGIYLPPSQFEACFISSAHTKNDFDATIKANYSALKSLI
jgi:glutamate-1-semialdehyde 2,1-aminomutase